MEKNENRRTVKALTEHMGKTAVYFRNDDICRIFLEDAEKEGILFENCESNKDKKPAMILIIDSCGHLSYPGFTGTCAFMNHKSVVGGMVRIDYEKYRSGSSEYLYGNPD